MTVEGLPTLLGGLAESGRRAANLTTPLAAIGASTVIAATPGTPRRTGHLAASVLVSASPGSLLFTSRAPYAVPVHGGRRKGRRGAAQPARPWLGNQVRRDTDQTTTTLATYLVAPITP